MTMIHTEQRRRKLHNGDLFLVDSEHPEPHNSDSKLTPEWLALLIEEAMGVIDLDPCSHPLSCVPARDRYVLPEDGLQLPWRGKVMCNPPYSEAAPWYARADEEARKGNAATALLHASTAPASQSWAPLTENAGGQLLLSDRVAFGLGDGRKALPAWCFVWLFGDHDLRRWARVFRGRGVVRALVKP